MLNDRQLPDGGTVAERYAERDGLPAGERDVARRIAAARLGLLRVVGALPGRWIELHRPRYRRRGGARDQPRRLAVRPAARSTGRPVDGRSSGALVVGTVGFLTDRVGALRELLHTYVDARGPGDAADGLATAMHAASREITVMLAPALGPAVASPKVA